jgi:hypothetical protein
MTLLSVPSAFFMNAPGISHAGSGVPFAWKKASPLWTPSSAVSHVAFSSSISQWMVYGVPAHPRAGTSKTSAATQIASKRFMSPPRRATRRRAEWRRP